MWFKKIEIEMEKKLNKDELTPYGQEIINQIQIWFVD
jgi:hypothetical protein